MINGNEPAMPFVSSDTDAHGRTMYEPAFGLTIRQHFAALAMQGMIASGVYIEPNTDEDFAKDEKGDWVKSEYGYISSFIYENDTTVEKFSLQTSNHQRVAREATMYSDALIAEFNKTA